MIGASAALQAALNVRQQPNDAAFVQRVEHIVRSSLNEVEFQAEFEAGRAMSLDEAVAFALDELKR